MLGGALPVETFSWSVVEFRGDQCESLGAVGAQVAVFPEVLPEQTIYVLVGSSLPWFPRVSEEHSLVEKGRDLVVACHFGTLIPGQRPSRMWGQL